MERAVWNSCGRYRAEIFKIIGLAVQHERHSPMETFPSFRWWVDSLSWIQPSYHNVYKWTLQILIHFSSVLKSDEARCWMQSSFSWKIPTSKDSCNIWNRLILVDFCLLTATSTLFLILFHFFGIPPSKLADLYRRVSVEAPQSLWTDHHGRCLELMRNFHSALKAFYSWYSSLWSQSLRALRSPHDGSQLAQDQVLTGGVQDYNAHTDTAVRCW